MISIAESAGEMLEATGAKTYTLARIDSAPRWGLFTKAASPAWAPIPEVCDQFQQTRHQNP
jgi:hypothetical protein